MANSYIKSKTVVGLGTFPFQSQTARLATISGKLSIPAISKGDSANSQVIVTLNLNGGATFYTGQAGATGFWAQANVVAGDVINVILTSSTAVDQGLNVISSTISLS